MPNWGHVLKEIQKEKDEPDGGESASDKVRKKYLMDLHKKVGERNVICYYSGFLSKPRVDGSEISDEDKNGFMLCVHGLDKTKGLDLYIHTQGGDGAATESIVHYLREIFGNDIRAFVPQIAMSAGTILALSCKEIFMGKHSNLGPIDPQVNGFPAYGVLAEVEQAHREITQDKTRAAIWAPILGNYNPSFIKRCDWAKASAKDMVEGFLKQNMFSALPAAERDDRAERVFEHLAELSSSKGHDKHIHYKECRDDIGLEIRLLEEKPWASIQDAVLTVHHCYMYTPANTPALKIIENHVGRRWVKVVQQQAAMQFNLPQDMIDRLNAEMAAESVPTLSRPSK